MTRYQDIEQVHLGNIEVEGRRYNVSLHVSYDGIEYVGRLWFVDESWDDNGFPDRASIPGPTREVVVEAAQRLSSDDLVRRFSRGAAERRRYHGLRKTTEEVLAKIRYLNQVAISMRAGLLDVEGAAQEIDQTEKQLHELIDRLRLYAGVEG